LKNALLRVYIGIAIHYCLFHYDQSLCRTVKKLRLRHLRREEDFDRLLKGLRAVPFLPPEEARQGAVELFSRFQPFFLAQSPLTRAKLQSESFFTDLASNSEG
jgi:hypothetical protein